MAKQLVYTSVPQGLWPGTTGYCTVLSTEGIPRVLAEFLEKTSVYRITDRDQGTVIPSTPEQYERLVELNPSNLAHLQFQVRGKETKILAKTCLAGFDYSNRLRKLSHFHVLDEHDMAQAGPAWLVAQPSVFLGNWGAKPTMLTEDKVLPSGSAEPAPCRAWQAAAGDAGYAGKLAASIKDKDRPVYVVVDQATDVLPLVQEAVALLPPERRWEVTFATRYVSLPQGVQCQWRFVRKDTPEHQEALQATGKLLIDLTSSPPRLGSSPEVDAARSGEYLDFPAPAGSVRFAPSGFNLPAPPPTDFGLAPLASPIDDGVFFEPAGTASLVPLTPAAPRLESAAPGERFRGAPPGRLAYPPPPGAAAAPSPPSPPVPAGPPPGSFGPPAPPRTSAPHSENDSLDTAPLESSGSGKSVLKIAGLGLGAVAALLLIGLAAVVIGPKLRPPEPKTGDDQAVCSGPMQGNLLDNDSPHGVVVTKIWIGDREYQVGEEAKTALGKLTVQADGKYTYVPNDSQVKALSARDEKEERFEYEIRNQRFKPQFAKGKVWIHVKGVNDPPKLWAAGRDSATYEFGRDWENSEEFRHHLFAAAKSKQGKFAIHLKPLELVSDPDSGALLTAELKSLGSQGASIVDQKDGTFFYYPNVLNMLGRPQGVLDADKIEFQISDGQASVTVSQIVQVPGLDLKLLAVGNPGPFSLREEEPGRTFDTGTLLNPFVNFQGALKGKDPETGSLDFHFGKGNEAGEFKTARGGTIKLSPDKKSLSYVPPMFDPRDQTDLFEDKIEYFVTNKKEESAKADLLISFTRKAPLTAVKLQPKLRQFIKQLKSEAFSVRASPDDPDEKEFKYVPFPRESADIAQNLDAELASRLDIKFISVFNHPESLVIQRDKGANWTILRMGGGDQPVAVLEYKDATLRFKWLPEGEKQMDAVRRLANVTRMTITAKVDRGENLPTESFQFLRPIPLEPRKEKQERISVAAGRELIPAQVLAEVVGEGTKFGARMVPAKIVPKLGKPDLEAELDKEMKAEIGRLLPDLTLKKWEATKPLELQLSASWENEVSKELVKVLKPIKSPDKVKAVRQIRNVVEYEIRPFVIAEGEGGAILLAAPAK